MKVLEAAKVIKVLERMKNYVPDVVGGRFLNPNKYISRSQIDILIKGLEERSFEVDMPGEKMREQTR